MPCVEKREKGRLSAAATIVSGPDAATHLTDSRAQKWPGIFASLSPERSDVYSSSVGGEKASSLLAGLFIGAFAASSQA